MHARSPQPPWFDFGCRALLHVILLSLSPLVFPVYSVKEKHRKTVIINANDVLPTLQTCSRVHKFQSGTETLNCKLTTLSQQLRIVNHQFLLCIPAAVDEKGLRERRENTSSGFQAFYNALGHENWDSCCSNDEMAHQRDLD